MSSTEIFACLFSVMMVDEVAKFACLFRVIRLIVPFHGTETFAYHYRLRLNLSLLLICPLNCVGRALTLISFYSYSLSAKEDEVKQGKNIS